MLALEASYFGLNQMVIEKASQHVIREGKRWGRYPMDMGKDLKRLKILLRRSATRAILESSDDFTPEAVSGWCGQKSTDLVAFYGNDFLEVIAIINYWGLWEYSDELLTLQAGR